MRKNNKMNSSSINRLFLKYVSQNILGMIGISAYVLVDTFFISVQSGTNGITALNLILPVYNVIFAIGSMIAVGSATRFAILRARGEKDSDKFLFNALFFAVLLSIPFILIGILCPDGMIALLGGDAEIIVTGLDYTRTFLLFAPFFMLNYIFNAFVRNDGAPSLAMTATLLCSIFNIIMDYIFMFPCGMGMTGAALATGLAPIVGIIVCGIHFFSKKNTLKIKPCIPSPGKLFRSCQLGVAAFVGEVSQGVTTVVFNVLILGLAGNTGVAAYGVVANTAMVATSIFNGISQGSQPLLSDFYGKSDRKSVNKIFRNSAVTAVSAAAVLITAVFAFAPFIVEMFNSEHNFKMAEYAVHGIKVYFIGFLFAGFNIAATGYMSATEKAAGAFCASVLRGFAAIVVCAIVMSRIFGIEGVWLAFCVSEVITSAAVIIFLAVVSLSRRRKQVL